MYFHSHCPSRQAGVGILAVAGIILLTLAAIAVKDVLWLALTADIVGTAALMPLIGFLLGYVMSVMCRLNAQ